MPSGSLFYVNYTCSCFNGYWGKNASENKSITIIKTEPCSLISITIQ